MSKHWIPPSLQQYARKRHLVERKLNYLKAHKDKIEIDSDFKVTLTLAPKESSLFSEFRVYEGHEAAKRLSDIFVNNIREYMIMKLERDVEIYEEFENVYSKLEQHNNNGSTTENT